jgi:hypothetical protein
MHYPSPQGPYHPFYGQMPLPSYGGPITPRRHGYSGDIPTSDGLDNFDDPDLYPRIVDWLQELDHGPRGADGHNFGQHALPLQTNMYLRVSQLEKLTKTDLLAMCSTMLPGTADLILDYARKECGAIRRREMKRRQDAMVAFQRFQ